MWWSIRICWNTISANIVSFVLCLINLTSLYLFSSCRLTFPTVFLLSLFSPRRHQFTSGDRVSRESGSRPWWDWPHEHRWTAACLRVSPTWAGHHTGNVAEITLAFIHVINQLNHSGPQEFWGPPQCGSIMTKLTPCLDAKHEMLPAAVFKFYITKIQIRLSLLPITRILSFSLMRT